MFYDILEGKNVFLSYKNKKFKKWISIIRKSINRNKKDYCSDNDHGNKYGVESHTDNNYKNVLDIIKTIELEPGPLSSWLDYK